MYKFKVLGSTAEQKHHTIIAAGAPIVRLVYLPFIVDDVTIDKNPIKASWRKPLVGNSHA